MSLLVFLASDVVVVVAIIIICDAVECIISVFWTCILSHIRNGRVCIVSINVTATGTNWCRMSYDFFCAHGRKLNDVARMCAVCSVHLLKIGCRRPGACGSEWYNFGPMCIAASASPPRHTIEFKIALRMNWRWSNRIQRGSFKKTTRETVCFRNWRFSHQFCAFALVDSLLHICRVFARMLSVQLERKIVRFKWRKRTKLWLDKSFRKIRERDRACAHIKQMKKYFPWFCPLSPLPIHDHLKHSASNVTKFMWANQNFLTNNFFSFYQLRVARSSLAWDMEILAASAAAKNKRDTEVMCTKLAVYIFAHWGVEQNLRFDKHLCYATNSMQTPLLKPNRLVFGFIVNILIPNPRHSTNGWFLLHALSLIVSWLGVLLYARCVGSVWRSTRKRAQNTPEQSHERGDTKPETHQF